MKKFIISIYEGFLTFLSWSFILTSCIAGYVWASEALGNGIIGVIIGLLIGVTLTVIGLGALLQIADIRKNIEKISINLEHTQNRKTVIEQMNRTNIKKKGLYI